ncbi:MAG TPA: PilT/PilU family type 4a pilus ATPase [Vicinamibacteria bacterium]|nr:PilT/PilU family type 4a pilus ATPase [Vicinamibacteria bacterium]
MAIFQSDARVALKRLADKAFETSQERDQLLAQLVSAEGLRGKDVAWMLFRPDRAYRDAVVAVLKRLADPETVDAVIAESKGKPEAAVRAAAATLFTLGIPGAEQRLAEIALHGKGEAQEVVRRLLVDAPVTPALEPVLWHLAATGRTEDRLLFLTRLAAAPPDPRQLVRWHRVVHDPEKAIREKALSVLAQRDPAGHVDLFVEQIPLVDYSTQQVLVEALTRAATGQGAAFADRILPLMASGEAATRSVVLKILLGMPDRRGIVRRYIVFSKSLAGWARDRALESMRAFGADVLEPTIELLADPDQEIRASAMLVAQSFEDPRIVPATIGLLKDPDWWIRITAAETLGRLKDPRGVLPLVEALSDPETRWSAVEALGRIGDLRAVPALSELLQDPAPEVRIEVIQALSHFDHPQMLDFVRNVAKQDPNRGVRARAFEITCQMAARSQTKLADEEALRQAALAARTAAGEPKLNALLVATRNSAASDLHLSVGQPPVLRIAADLVRAQGEVFTAEQTEALVREILSDAQWERLRREKQLDFCHYIPTAGRYRANVFVDQKGTNGVFRVIPERPPTIAEIGLPPHLAEIADYHQGLVIVCGPSGSGKSTTLAALVNLFNETRHDHVITMEDPVEFVHPFKSCLVNQREVGKHTGSFARALRAALREDPDVIVIGELRDNESVSLALTAAETGHIVLGTLNSTSAPKAVDRVLSSFPAAEQGQVRAALSESLKFVIAQRLLPAKEPRQQVACFEVLRNTVAVANMIREEKTFQIPSAMQIGKSLGMQTFDDALRALLAAGRISGEAAYRAASKKEEFEAFLAASRAEGRKP